MSAMMTRQPVRVLPRPAADEIPAVHLTREQIVDSIISMNHTASVEFLSSFTDRALRMYMEHLQSINVPRGRNARWVRPSNVPAVCMHECED